MLHCKGFGRLTQLGECLLDVEEVTGSSPVSSTIANLNRTYRFGLVFLLDSYSLTAVFKLYAVFLLVLISRFMPQKAIYTNCSVLGLSYISTCHSAKLVLIVANIV